MMSHNPGPADNAATRAERLVLAAGGSADAGAVFAALSSAYTVHAEPAAIVHWTWLDTADWRLRRAGVALREERQGRHRELLVEGGRQPAVTPVTGVRWPAKATDLPPSDVRDAVAGPVGVRALLPVAEIETRRIPLKIMDAAGKTRVRVTVDQQRLLIPRRAALPLHLVVEPLRGYGEDARECGRLLAEAMGAESTSLSATDAALAAAGHLPGAPDSDPYPIAATDAALRPVAAALLGYVEVVDDARDGALADLDTEFLHDLRTAIRSTRALLAAAGHLLPGRSGLRVERDLAWLDEQTACLRAIDITLLHLEGGDPGPGDPADDRSGGALAGLTHLAPLRDELTRRRRNELRRMRRTLRAPRAPAAFTAWRRDLGAMVDADVIGPSALEAARTLARAEYGRVRDTSGSQPDTEPDTAAGETYPLRLAALAEVLTAFAPLYPETASRTLDAEIGTLRELLRQRDGARIVAREIRAAVGAGASHPAVTLPVETVLAAGAVVDRAVAREARLQHRIDEAHQKLASKRGRRRVEAVTA